MKSFNSMINNINYQINWYPKSKDTFRYTVIDNLFKVSLVSDMLTYFSENMKNKMSKFLHYDCNVLCINPKDKHPFDFIYSIEWKNFISNIFPDIPLTNNTVAEIQHHNIGSPNGWVHNDFDAAHFVNNPLDNGINVWYHNCPYRQNKPNYDLITNVRSIVLMYHLNDKPNWREGDGGETAFYSNYTKDVEDHFLKINPVQNRLVVYEINPFSYHSFKSNIKHERTTFIQWYHSSMEDTKNRFTSSHNFYRGVSNNYGKK